MTELYDLAIVGGGPAGAAAAVYAGAQAFAAPAQAMELMGSKTTVVFLMD